MRYGKIVTIWLTAALAGASLAACSKEVELDRGGGAGDAVPEEVSVVMTLTMPGSSAASRSLTADEEAAVNNVDIFVFDKDLKLTDWQYGLLVEDAGQVSFSARLRSSRDANDKFRIMVLANAREITYPIFKDADFGGHKGKSYSQVRALLQASVPDYPTVASKGIPMWGEIEQPVLIDNANRSYSMNLLRSLARVDIGTNPTPTFNPVSGEASYAALTNFSLEEVYVYNAGSSYTLAPERDNYSFTDKKVSAVSLPSPNPKKAAPERYSDNITPGTVTRDGGIGYAVTAGIYAGEADILKGASGSYGDGNHAERMAVVVAGYYTAKGEPENTSTLSYYRLDFKDGTNATKLVDVMRNCDYQIVIRSVSGPGSSTPEEAMEKYNADMVAVVKTWTNAEQDATVIDGQYYLSIDRYDIKTDKWSKADEEVVISTNVTGGWRAEVTAGGDWLTLTGGPTAAGGNGDILFFNVSEIPSAVSSRQGRITITAGTMSMVLHVVQTDDDSNFRLLLSAASIVFPGRQWDESGQQWGAPDAQTLKIDWFPVIHDYELALAPYVGGGVTGFAPPAASDEHELEVEVDMIDETNPRVEQNPFFERSSILTVTAWNADRSENITKQVLVRQVFHSLVVSGTEDYYFQGKTYTLNIKANTAWTADFGGANIFSSSTGTSGTGNSSVGENLSFTINAGAAPNATATITFRSPDNLFPPQTFDVVAQDELPNCYIVTPGNSVTIPVRKAYRVWKYDRDLKDLHTNGDLPVGNYGAELLWQDVSNMITGVTYNGHAQPDQASITVATRAGTTGNAVVKFTIDGTVYWSWHIWVTAQNLNILTMTANQARIMDRHIGAINAISNDDGSIGLIYQGGRKDPFPLAASFSNGNRKPIYNINGTVLTYEDPSSGGIYYKNSPLREGLPEIIKNPNIYHEGNYGTQDWYGLLSEQRGYFWHPVYKSDYDPCPAGWKIGNNPEMIGVIPAYPYQNNNVMVFDGVDWPAQGYINFTLMTRSENREAAPTWTTQPPGSTGRPVMRPFRNGTVGGNTLSTCYGNPVRCVVDD